MKDHICDVLGEDKKFNIGVVKWESLFNFIQHINIHGKMC